MRRQRVTHLLWALIGSLGLSLGLSCDAADATGWRARLQAQREGVTPRPAWTTPGTHRVELRHDGLTRHALVHLPPGFRPGQSTSLVLAFHGGGGDAAYMADDDRYGLISLADRENFVIVFPSGYSRWPRGKLATWNAGDCGPCPERAAGRDPGWAGKPAAGQRPRRCSVGDQWCTGDRRHLQR